MANEIQVVDLDGPFQTDAAIKVLAAKVNEIIMRLNFGVTAIPVRDQSDKIKESEIYKAVMDELQEAEELGGPEGLEYDRLMETISAECLDRRDCRRANNLASVDIVQLVVEFYAEQKWERGDYSKSSPVILVSLLEDMREWAQSNGIGWTEHAV